MANSFAENKKEDKKKEDKKVTKPQNPCEKDSQSFECKNHLKALTKDYPCTSDLTKFCFPKIDTGDAKTIEATKKTKVADIDKCLEKNFNKLSPNCKKSIQEKRSSSECMEVAMTRCSELKGDKQINCLTEEEAQAFAKCQKKNDH